MPFDVDEANPADDSIVSQFPANERASRAAIVGILSSFADEATGYFIPPDLDDTNRDALAGKLDKMLVFNWAASKFSRWNAAQNRFDEFGFIGAGDMKVAAYDPSAPPEGWLACDGASYATTAHPRLFEKIGYSFGGAGANFNVPDLKSRMPMGFHAGGDGDGDHDAIGETGGEKKHTLILDEIPSHSHGGSTGSAGAHQHTFVSGQGGTTLGQGPFFQGAVGAPNYSIGNGTTDSAGAHTHTITAEGGGLPHENRPLFVVVGWLIKT